MKRWVLALTGLVLAVSGTASAKDLPTIDAFANGASAPRTDARVRKQAPGMRVSRIEPKTGSPAFVWGNRSAVDERLQSALLRMSPEQAARVHLGRVASLYQLTPEVVSTASASVQALFDGRGGTLVTFRQEVEGIEVFRNELTVAMNARRELIALSGYLSPHASPGTKSTRLRFTLDAPHAIAIAYEDLNGRKLDAASLTRVGQAQGAYTSFGFTQTAATQYPVRMVTPARAKKVFFALPGQLVPAWYLELNTGLTGQPEADYYAYVVAADDGRLLFRNNLTVADAFTYRVWAQNTSPYLPDDGPQGLVGTPHPTGNPDGYQAPFVAPGLVTLQNSPFSQNDPWLPASATETNGNNVDAYVDISGDDGLDADDFRATTTSTRTFDRVYDVTQEPDITEHQQMAAVTQLFYVNNFLHDWFYDAGFNEASRNAQADNFGRGGLDNDSLRAEAQDFSGFNNANMATPADGARPRMQMYLFSPNTVSTLSVLAPDAIEGLYEPGTAEFGPLAFTLTGDVALVQDAGGTPTDGCEAPFANAAEVAGKVALIDRGTCTFVVKVKNAQEAGATGVIIVNNASGGAPGLGGDDPSITVPTLSLSLEDGALIKQELPNGPVTVRLFREAGVFRDGALDNAIVAHEWGHYISNRLIYNGNGLSNNQGRSMGEGWADFHALLMMVREEDSFFPGNDNFQGAYGVGGYASSGGDNDGYLFGTRRYPYSTQFTRNPLTFKHIEDGVELPPGVSSNPGLAGIPNAEVHNSGEVWASMLWECYTALLKDRTRLTFAEAQARMKAYLVASYKLTPPSPTFTDARDALLVAAYLGDPVDFKLFHAAFARRGAGLRAQSPSPFSADHAGVVESFVTGKDVELGGVELLEAPGACDEDGVLDSGEAGILRVTVYNTGTDTVSATTAKVATTTPGITLANGGNIVFPPIPPFLSATVDLAVSMDGPSTIVFPVFNITYRDADQAIPGDREASFVARANTDDAQNTSKSDDVEANIGPWIPARDENLGDYAPWFRYEEYVDTHFFYGVDAPEIADIYLISPPLHVSATEDFGFTFHHRYAFEYNIDVDDTVYFWDGGVIEISTDDGQTWADIGSQATPGYDGVIPPDGGNPLENREAFGGISKDYPEWIQASINLGKAFAGQTVRVRFRIGSDVNTGSVGWDVDNLSFTGIDNTPFSVLVAEADPCTGNTPPVANAGPDQTVDERTPVTLAGSGTDADEDPLTYAWTQTAGPAVTLSNTKVPAPTFTAPEVTANTPLTFQLTVSDGKAFATDTVTITVNQVNRAPVANAGPDQTVDERTPVVTLDGRGSSDPDAGSTLTYAWTQTAGPSVTLTGANTAQPTFAAPEVTANTPFTFELTVSDGLLSATDTVTITVRNVNRPPVANAGPDQTVNENAPVALNGTGSSDPDTGTTLTYAWVQTAGSPTVTLTGANTAQPTFTAPGVSATTEFTFRLTVSDGSLTATDTVTITVNNINTAPVANAGPDQTVNERTPVTLEGSGTDAENGTLTYAWTQTAGPTAPLTGANTPNPTFTAPEVTGTATLTFRLVVNDGTENSAPDTVNIIVNNVNRQPVANAGADQTVNERTPVTLDGSGSSDPDSGTTLTYAWVQTAGSPTVTLSNPAAAKPTFQAPEVTANTELTFQLTVSDNSLSSTDTVTITVRNVNRRPVANAGPDVTVDERSTLVLSGSGTDLDGDTLGYRWTQTAGPTATLSSTSVPNPSFTVPEVTGTTTLTFQLVVNDNTEDSAADTVNVTVRNVNRAPAANAGEDQNVPSGAAVTLDGSGSSDPDEGTTLTYQWTQTAGPTVTLTGAATAKPGFTAPTVTAATSLTFQLRVSDGAASSTDTVTVLVRPPNRRPVAHPGAARTVDERTEVTLDATGSTDPDSDTLTYEWTQTAGPSVTLSSATAAKPGFTAPEVTAETVLTFRLVVSDGSLSSEATLVNVTVRNVNRAPVTNAGPDQTLEEGAAATLAGSATDPDGDTLSYQWTQTAGPSVTLSGATTATATFTAPDVSSDTELRFTLTVTDANGLSSEDSVSLTVTAKDDGGGDDGDGGGCGCATDSGAGPLMPLLMLGMVLLSRRRLFSR